MVNHNVIYSVLSHHSKDLNQQTSVTAWLQLKSFIQQAKDSTSSRHEGGPNPKERPQSFLALFLHLFICLLPAEPALCRWASQEGGVFVASDVLTPVHGYSFVPFSRAFPFLCLLATTIFDSFFLFYLPTIINYYFFLHKFFYCSELC